MPVYKLLICTLFVLPCLQQVVFAQERSNTGTDFWVGYGHHQFMEPSMSNSQEMVLYITTEQAANVKVSIHGSTWVRNYSIPANTTITTEMIPKSGIFDARLYSVPPAFGGTGGEGVFANKGIHIESDVPVVAYAHIYGSASSGATMLMPVNTWGYAYISVNSEQNYQDNCFSWMYVVAKEDNTVIEITPSVPTRNGRVAGIPFTVTLMKGSIYQLVGAPLGAGKGAELTGTKVRSLPNAAGNCYPVGVFSGSSRTAIGCTAAMGSTGDNNIQQVFPAQAWGKRYLAAPTSTDNNAAIFHTNIYKVVVKDPATVVKRNGAVLSGLVNNTYYQFESNTAEDIEANGPIMVAQFMTSAGVCLSGNGDPEMIYLSPIEQGIKRTQFYRNTTESINVNYLTLIIPTTGLASLKIDGSNSFTHTYPHPNAAGYTVVVKRWNAVKAQCIVESDVAFTAITYGLGSVESYGYNAGMQFNALGPITQIKNEYNTQPAPNTFACVNTPVQVSMLLPYQPVKLVWELSKLGAVVTPGTDIVDNAPVAAATAVIAGVTYYKYLLPQKLTFTAAADYEIPVLVSSPVIDNCNNTTEFNLAVMVKEGLTADITVTHPTGCALDPITFDATVTGTDGTATQWDWEFPGGETATGISVEKTLAAGSPEIKLTVLSSEGCQSATTKTMTVYNPPTADFNVSATVPCEGKDITITGTATYDGTAPVTAYSWDFGNGTTLDAANDDPQTATYSTAATYEVKYTVKLSDRCVSDEVVKEVTIYANPDPSFTHPTGCLPADGLIQFTSTATIADGQTLTHAWNFDDPDATAANPNTATDENPIHNYKNMGDYNIHYKVTTEKGCIAETTVPVSVKLPPAITYATPAQVCENEPGPVSVANASAVGGIAGTGIYSGPGTDADGSFTPSMAGAGTHTITYTFTATAIGCEASATADIVVAPKPITDFTATHEVCLNEEVQLEDQSTIPTGTITKWNWDFGDGTQTVSLNNNIIPKKYNAHNSYDVKLIPVSDQGCKGEERTQSVTVYANPAPSFTHPATCLPADGLIQFTSTTTIADGQLLTHAWNFNDPDATAANPNTATDESPVHHYTNEGNYTIHYKVTTANGCIAETTVPVNVKLPPAITFTTPAQVCENEPGPVSVANASVTNGVVGTGIYSGAGTAVDGLFTPSQAGAGTHTITYTFTTATGCVGSAIADMTVAPKPVTGFTATNEVCLGEEVKLQDQSTIATGRITTWNWDFGDGTQAVLLNNNSILKQYNAPATYPVKLRPVSDQGCEGNEVTVPVAVHALPVADFILPAAICMPEGRAVFTNASTVADNGRLKYEWRFGDGNAGATTTDPEHIYTGKGPFTVALMATSSHGCANTITKTLSAFFDAPVIDAGPSFMVPAGTVVTFRPTAPQAADLTFRWTPAGDFADPSLFNQTLVAQQDATYTLTATSLQGCTATDKLMVSVQGNIHVPNAFTPNGDGLNDTWGIPGLARYPDCKVEVFNRYGQPVYQSAGYSSPWNGRQRGVLLPMGTYIYVIRLQKDSQPITGELTLLK